MSIVNSIQTFFRSPENEQSLAKGLPMHMLEMARIAYKDAGIPIRIKYRGSRKSQVGITMKGGNGRVYKRTSTMANQTCLKAYATSFAIYPQ